MSPQQTPFFGRKISRTGINVTQATDNQLVVKEDYNLGNTIYYDASGIASVLIGLRPLTNVRGFYVAQPGIDVRTATDAQLSFNSQQDTFKIVEKGSATIPSFTIGSGGTNVALITIPHNLPFTPLVDVYVKGILFSFLTAEIASSYIPLPIYNDSYYFFPSSSAADYSLQILYGIDSTNLYIQALYPTATGTLDTILPIPVTYFFRQETAT